MKYLCPVHKMTAGSTGKHHENENVIPGNSESTKLIKNK